MFEKSALLMICCDISTKSFENVHLTCENSTKANKKKLYTCGWVNQLAKLASFLIGLIKWNNILSIV